MPRKPRIPGTSEGAFGFLLHDIAGLMRKNFNQRVQHLGLTQAQYRVILHLSRCEGLQQVALAERLEIQPITLARLLDKLEAAKMVERRRDPKDRRAFCLYLTPAAYPLLQKILKLAQQTRVDAVGSLTQKELTEFFNTLTAMKENLLRVDAGSPASHPGSPSVKPREAP
jgi:DNA-binding MarR family transcriptional regulator